MADLPTLVLTLIATMESASGMPIAELDRISDTQQFWARTAVILCEKTKDPWCDTDVRFMTANTELSGMSRIIEYKIGQKQKKVCALLPPIPNIDPSYVGDAFGTPFMSPELYPSNQITAQWLMLYHAAHCLDTKFDDKEEERAKAFATLALAMLDGNPAFTPGLHKSPYRTMAVISGGAPAYWAAGAGERVLLDYWKNQSANILQSAYKCDVKVTVSSTIDTENIVRARSLGSGDCSSPGNGGRGMGTVSDENLWIWMYGNGGLGAPPKPYEPMGAWDGDFNKGFAYIWKTANNLAGIN